MADKGACILKTAERLFAAGRYHEVTLDDISKEAGVGKGTVYRYFKDKEDLFWQVILSGLDELVESVQEVQEQEPEPGEGLRKVARCIADFFTGRGALFGLMWSESFRGSGHRKKFWKQWRSKEEGFLAVTMGFIARGMEQGRYASRLSPRAGARLLLGMIRTALWNWEDMPDGDQWPVAIVELFENGILPRESSQSK